MRMLIGVAVGLAVALPAMAQAPVPNPYSARLAKLPDLQRRAAMRRAVLDSGQYCKRVEGTAQRGPYKNLVMWVAQCDRGVDYAVFVGADGSVQVRPCTDVAQLKLPSCGLAARRRG